MKQFFSIVYILNVVSVCAASNQLMNLFHHKGILGDKIVCYFNEEPNCQVTVLQETDKEKQVEYFIPHGTVNNAVRKMVDALNGAQGAHYIVKVSQEKKPREGIKFIISYNPAMIVCDYGTCDSISMYKSLVFNLHNKSKLRSIEAYNGSVLRQASCNKKPHIMLDFGHGGHDLGKVGCSMIKEKDINMQVGKKLASLLEHKGYEVSLVRENDTYVSLDARTTLANKKKVDLFVSLHSNAGNPAASGVETYWSPRASIKRTVLAGNKEQDCETAIKNSFKLLDTASKTLATEIQNNVIALVSQKHPVVNRKVKQSIAQVLLGADMPSALIEMGFLSNPLETQLLAKADYQYLLAQGICNGIDSYCKTVRIV
ncbi:MAG: N-acetylmuramoyl-L-alanine amidase [Candidatus Babeliales bacterium]